MKFKGFCVTVLITGIILCTFSAPLSFAQEEQRSTVIIPPEVKTVFQAGIQSREVRADIPFQITHSIFLPAGQQNLHAVIFFKAKNIDLGFAPPAAAPQAEAQEEQPAPTNLVAQNYVFLQFNKLETQTPGELVKEIYIPFQVEEESASYDPEQEGLYTTGYPLPPGNYLLSMAVTSRDFQKIGTQYLEVTLPDPLSFTDIIDTTPIIFAKDIKQVATPETTAEVHKDFFAYSILQIEPNLERIFAPQENLDIFFFIFGVQANAQGQSDIEVHYEVYQGEELVINYTPQKYQSPLVSQPLPMKKTVLVRTTKGTETSETREQRNLEAGSYSLSITITDNISTKTVKKTIDFEVGG
ncbi:MAG: hypothetical protein JSV17_09120 [Candidatus Aminicenantes bacterium]|nr:MAG: hypothetical protein JSV17_09120 [Candidatus Aminicenantes bacterium]